MPLTSILNVQIQRLNQACPFSNPRVEFSIRAGQCFWLKGPSGVGKSTIARAIAGLDVIPGAQGHLTWTKNFPKEERVGVLFQQGVLIDTLNVAENIVLSCRNAGLPYDDGVINQHLKSVGLKETDRNKMPNELSGGMLRRACLAQILAQRKKLIILDEPFVGLDPETCEGILETLTALKKKGQAFLLISHEPDFSSRLADPDAEFVLQPMIRESKLSTKHHIAHWRYLVRLSGRFIDYLGISIPLIACAFVAIGLAMSTLFTQLLDKIDVPTIVQEFQAKQQTGPKKPSGGLVASIKQHFINKEMQYLNRHYMPEIKRKIYALVLMKTFLIEVGPLLTGILLVGRIGGSYAGEVAMMQATNQNRLLQTLGISPRRWTLSSTSVAALISAPILTALGTAIGLWMAAVIGTFGTYHIYHETQQFWVEVMPKIFDYDKTQPFWHYPPIINAYRSIGFMIITLAVSEYFGRRNKNLQPRHVPRVITWSVVIASLLILIADWGFTEILVYF
ncbi:MAG TPA: ATP-binding cassette domain-containing protein [Coxiellaceae bacterium]|nr:ATP-binding cassette domain-containing protein [Coxiellaceae bacterium]